MHRLLIIIRKCRWKSYEIHCGIEALANFFNAVTSCFRHLSLNTASQTHTSANLYCGLTFKDTHHERNIHSDSLLCSSSHGATPMPAINAVYSRNNLTEQRGAYRSTSASTVRRQLAAPDTALVAHQCTQHSIVVRPPAVRAISTDIICQTNFQHCRTSDLELTATCRIKLRLSLSLYFQIKT